MEVSSTQLSGAILDAVAAQTPPAPQSNRPAPAQQPPSTEVTLSRDARERIAQSTVAQQAPAAENVTKNPVQPANEAPSSQEETGGNAAVQAQEIESRRQQANVAVKAQENAATYSARVAAQSYVNVSNF